MNPDAPTAPDLDPQCPLLLQRIDELQDHLSHEAEPMRRRHGRRQLRLLTERARCLGCLNATRPRPGIDPPPP
jgi:hypothetical protein